MGYSFNLLEEQWIPCVDCRGRLRMVSLRDALAEAHEIREIVDESPLVAAALHRLMLAILHRVFGPARRRDWEEMWRARCWDVARLDEYFEKWRHRFDLFDDARPFYQTPGLDQKMKWGPVQRLSPAAASGNNPTLFSHETEASPRPVPAATAARSLLAVHVFHASGTVARGRGEPPSATAAPLATAAVTMPVGDDLFQTLMLNLVRYDPAEEAPFAGQEPDDAPAWEQDEPAGVETRYPKGYLDYLTWQSRRVLLRPARDDDGRLLVTGAILADGRRFPDNFSIFGREQMTAHRVIEKAKGKGEARPALCLSRERAFWRDSTALFESAAAGEQSETERPRVISWLAELVGVGVDLEPRHVLRLSVAGQCTDQSKAAKIHFWRRERLPLPLRYLEDRRLVRHLKEALILAEDVGKALSTAAQRAERQASAQAQAGQAGPKTTESTPQTSAKREERESLVLQLVKTSALPTYWSGLEAEFLRLLTELADPEKDPARVREWWGQAVLGWAWGALDQVLATLPEGLQALRLSVATRGFFRMLSVPKLNRFLGIESRKRSARAS
ncbi:MAG: type I-E CRISPR-associated protein Cse1/CasA [Armatimonadetes bacterium]|nr:type I-E CRISPR-associated protein Cse1/CasA [Armatimonadota bacterium]